MKWLYALISSAAVLIGTAAVSGQEYEELEAFQADAGELSILFRGREAMNYKIPHNGTYLWGPEDFAVGDLMFNGRLYHNLYMNIDAVRQEPLVCFRNRLLPVALDPVRVEWFTMGERKFVNASDQGIPEVPEGFFEIIYSGKMTLLKHVEKAFASRVENTNGAIIGYDDPDYRDKVLSFFGYYPSYFLRLDDGEVVRIKHKQNILRYLPDRKAVKKHMASYGPGRRISFDEYCREAFRAAGL